METLAAALRSATFGVIGVIPFGLSRLSFSFVSKRKAANSPGQRGRLRGRIMRCVNDSEKGISCERIAFI